MCLALYEALVYSHEPEQVGGEAASAQVQLATRCHQCQSQGVSEVWEKMNWNEEVWMSEPDQILSASSN